MGIIRSFASGAEPTAAEIGNALTESDEEFERRMALREKALERRKREARIATVEWANEFFDGLQRRFARRFRRLDQMDKAYDKLFRG